MWSPMVQDAAASQPAGGGELPLLVFLIVIIVVVVAEFSLGILQSKLHASERLPTFSPSIAWLCIRAKKCASMYIGAGWAIISYALICMTWPASQSSTKWLVVTSYAIVTPYAIAGYVRMLWSIERMRSRYAREAKTQNPQSACASIMDLPCAGRTWVLTTIAAIVALATVMIMYLQLPDGLSMNLSGAGFYGLRGINTLLMLHFAITAVCLAVWASHKPKRYRVVSVIDAGAYFMPWEEHARLVGAVTNCILGTSLLLTPLIAEQMIRMKDGQDAAPRGALEGVVKLLPSTKSLWVWAIALAVTFVCLLVFLRRMERWRYQALEESVRGQRASVIQAGLSVRRELASARFVTRVRDAAVLLLGLVGQIWQLCWQLLGKKWS